MTEDAGTAGGLGVKLLRSHLEAAYGIRVRRISELDLGVFRVDRRDGPSWVARLFPAGRPVEAVAGDAEILRFLASHDFPAERCATSEPVSVLGGQGLLVTDHVEGVPKIRRVDTIRGLGGFWSLGVMLGRLHTLPGAAGAVARDGGAWHHLADGGPRDEIAAAARLLDDASGRVTARERPAYESLRNEIDHLDDCDGLPQALTHPDFVLANVIASPDRGLVVVDWAGAGRGSRLWSLAFLLFTAGARGLNRVDSAVTGYLCHVRLEPEELSRLAEVICVRPAIFEVWGACKGRKSLTDARRGLAGARKLADAIVTRALAAFRDGAKALPVHSERPRQDPPARARLGDFDLAALYAALDDQRRALGLSWQGVAREISRSSGHVPGTRPLSASTMTGMLKRTSLEGDGVLGMLEWLGCPPESFVPNHPAPTTPETKLPPTPPGRILRWDVPALHAAVNAQRAERAMTWKQVADEIGGFTPGMLTGLAKAERIGFPRVMRLIAWLGQPAVRFMRQSSH